MPADTDEYAQIWADMSVLNEPIRVSASAPPPRTEDEDEEMWNIANELELEAEAATNAKAKAMGISSTGTQPEDAAQSAMRSHDVDVANDDDIEDMYL